MKKVNSESQSAKERASAINVDFARSPKGHEHSQTHQLDHGHNHLDHEILGQVESKEHDELVHHEPVHHEPVHHEPVHHEPVHHEPVHHEPVHHEHHNETIINHNNHLHQQHIN